MQITRLIPIVPAALVLSACALLQPIKEKNAVNDADDCIATQARVAAPSATALEAAVNFTLTRCDVEIHASENALLAQTANDGRSASLKIADLRRSQRELARRLISLERAT
ncbi:hypothetical protein P7D22_01640 [Lichenihabitans sp. Uapishka_5]|uniref:hypothetical protein n=1 Tax=Lichenihabitans sp. Uapishka_5 TaxID=3037302 RepID=UPI0029E7EE3A|nr:hypothetical protein [Lichenihabitans sp. Uapishka_5]MDX7949878.1 hypothetical protein [Lichenihabitans sp. Uapishka_5]